jgi:hypothetical protein
MEMEMSNQTTPNEELVSTLDVEFLCIQCNSFSEDLNKCTQCGEPVNGGVVEVQIVGNELKCQVAGENRSEDQVEAETSEAKEAKGCKSRRREINCFGMFLKEQKEISKKKSQKLDSEVVSEIWSRMSDSEKARYKQQSLKDRDFIVARKVTQSKEKKKIDTEDIVRKKKMKNKKDTELKAQKREESAEMKKDLDCSRKMLDSMIVEKKDSSVSLTIEIELKDKEIEDVSNEIKLSEKLLLNKKERLVAIKKEYKELFNLCSIINNNK